MDAANRNAARINATADVNPPDRPLEAIYYDKSKKRRVTGPVEYALDRNDETAWTTDNGPGRSNVPRKAVFTFEQPLAFAGRTKLKFRLSQNHGGWNSDDNQNYNLGRFRLSVTSAADPAADPLPAAVREVLGIPAGERTPAQVATLFGYWRTTVPEWSPENARIEELWADCRARFGGGGPWLFGEYGIADAMYAPMVLRFRTYGARLRESSAAYCATVIEDPVMREWLDAAAAESWVNEASEIGR